MSRKLTLIIVLVLLLNSFIGSTHAIASDINCLKEIKASLEDPFGYLNSSWNFDNNTEGFICKFIGVVCWHGDESKVLNLQLSDMGLKGTFPRGVTNCTSLTGLDLSNNNLSGNIPYNISRLIPFVTSLNLSSNNFSGEIPISLANCTYLNVLKLDHNRLTGNIPRELPMSLARLKEFSVANNILSGEVSDSYSRFTAISFANNLDLCGGPLGPCHFHKHHMKPLDPFKVGFGTGYFVSATVVFFTLSVSWFQVKMIMKSVIFSVVENLQKRKQNEQLHHFPTLKHQKEISQLEKMVNRMSFPELCKATDNFSIFNVIGRGNTGTMYKATLSNGWFLAVKKIDDTPNNEAQFVSELLALARMRHDNLIPLLGFCMVENERLLVYKHMTNGNLHDYLHRVEEGDAKILQWPLRIKIGMGIARGLAWLLGMANGAAKISNFGKAIISNYGGVMFVYPNESDSGLFVNSGVWESDFVKKDVYDCGTVLLELITGSDSGSGSGSNLHNTLVEWISHVSTSPGILNDAIDKALIGQGFDDEILDMLRIARDCVHPMPYERPTMLQVYERMSNIGLRYGIPCDFGLLLQPKRS
ncbi:hypothetical protein G4B88_003921 [Cannabis sativa]|uniref:Protein kinase domain-containing protein n=1 Tax=Cannabis sativa TaxID=3483 RepID=A0A7J6GXA5_CANSA|nr:hypothetical protein G4B88_003921 [Cannabis sativa]